MSRPLYKVYERYMCQRPPRANAHLRLSRLPYATHHMSPLKNMRWVECQLVAKLGLKTTFKSVKCAAAAWRKRSA
jgi:hypothetical protein